MNDRSFRVVGVAVTATTAPYPIMPPPGTPESPVAYCPIPCGDPIITHTEGVQTITLSSEVLLLSRDSRLSHQKFIHLPAMTQ